MVANQEMLRPQQQQIKKLICYHLLLIRDLDASDPLKENLITMTNKWFHSFKEQVAFGSLIYSLDPRGSVLISMTTIHKILLILYSSSTNN